MLGKYLTTTDHTSTVGDQTARLTPQMSTGWELCLCPPGVWTCAPDSTVDCGCLTTSGPTSPFVHKLLEVRAEHTAGQFGRRLWRKGRVTGVCRDAGHSLTVLGSCSSASQHYQVGGQGHPVQRLSPSCEGWLQDFLGEVLAELESKPGTVAILSQATSPPRLSHSRQAWSKAHVCQCS